MKENVFENTTKDYKQFRKKRIVTKIRRITIK